MAVFCSVGRREELGWLVSLWSGIGSSPSDSVADSRWPFGTSELFARRWTVVPEVGFWDHQTIRRERAIVISETMGHTEGIVFHCPGSLLTGMDLSTSSNSTSAIWSGGFSAAEMTGANSLSNDESFK